MRKTSQIMLGIIAVCLLAGVAEGTHFGPESVVQRKTEPKSEVQKRLFLAVKRNDLKEAERCLKLGARVNDSDENGLAPLHYAAVCRHVEMVKWLLAHGADVNKKNKWDWTPLHYTLGSDDFTEELCPKPDPEKTLELVKLLVEAKANVNAEDNHGVTPVYLALDDPEILKYLVKHGVILAGGDAYHGKTLLHWAVVYEAPVKTIELILKHGGKNDINDYDGDGYTPLHRAVLAKNLQVVKLLVEHGANINLIIDEENKTALDLAEEVKLPEIVKYLKAHGAVKGKSTGKSVGH